MKARMLFAAAVVLVLGFVLGDASQSRPKLTAEPDPSYAEDAVSKHRHPEVATDVSLYINHWRNSLPHEGHGGLIERGILTAGDPRKTPRERARLEKL